ncbi:MAG: flagellar hook-basal body protein [bacterium]
MNAGLNRAISGCLVQEKRLQTISDNLSHIQQTGYKQDRLAFRQKNYAAVVDEIKADLAQGAPKETGNTFDLGLAGDGFFTIRTPFGIAYTRKGNFTRGKDGQLLTQEGFQVLGQKGPLRVRGNTIIITKEGDVFSDNRRVDRLRIASFTDPASVKKITPGLFQVANPALERRARGYVIQQGQIELSNVNMMKEMVRMIEVTRNFESCQKAVQSIDSITGLAVNRVGSI